MNRKPAMVKTIMTARDRQSAHDSYTLVVRAGKKGTGRELGRVRVWGDSEKSMEKGWDAIYEILRRKGYTLYSETPE